MACDCLGFSHPAQVSRIKLTSLKLLLVATLRHCHSVRLVFGPLWRTVAYAFSRFRQGKAWLRPICSLPTISPCLLDRPLLLHGITRVRPLSG